MAIVIADADEVRIKFEATVNRLGSGVAKKVFSMALNKEGRKSFTQVKRKIAEISSLKPGEISQFSRFKPAYPSNLQTVTEGRRYYFPLKHFRPKQNAKGTSAMVWGMRKQYDHAFIVPEIGGHVFVRTSSKRLPIHKMYGPSVHVEIMRDPSVGKWKEGHSAIMLEATRLLGLMMSGKMK